ncbi:Kelch-like protein [Echinococcus granulosus]|uniref:Kelch-like protein n=1 Tax=Echinococcus granulosus TaxID=6210 RepID=W6UM52_ECHGR|nr:Kelch-like protein [Echinococcus granulosus]EUB59202.1 Kelch-like protein [Echinococcus granulosus]
MEALEYTEENADCFPGHIFRHFRTQGKLIDLRIMTKDEKCVKAHRMILAARFPLIRKAMTSGEGKMVVQWKRFSEDIVEAVINYAYTGSLTISAENATRLYMLAHNLGSGRLVSWCEEFLGPRITLDNVGEIWSIANITLNSGLMEACIPLMSKNFENLCFRRDLLRQTTSEYLEILLENKQPEGVSEETKFRAISEWLEAGFDVCDLEKRAKEFTKIISKIDLTGISPQFLTEFWKLGEGICRITLCRNYFTKSWNEVNQQRDQAEIHAVNIASRRKMTQFSFLEDTIMDDAFLSAKDWTPPVEDMPTARHGMSALNIADFGIVVVGGSDRADSNLPLSRDAEMLMKVPTDESGWQWKKLRPMLKERYRPGIACFNRCVVVAGGDSECSVESLSLTSKAQWTRLLGVNTYGPKITSLVAFNNRLILLSSDDSGGDAYEFLHNEGDQSLENYAWKPIFRLGNMMSSRLLVTREKLE